MKAVTNTRKCMRDSPTIVTFLQCNGGTLEEAEDFKCVCVIYCVLESKYISSSSELLSNNSMRVGQVSVDK